MMYDNTDFKMRKEYTTNIDFLAETPIYLTNADEGFKNGISYVTGRCGVFKVYVYENGVNISGGSLAKYFLGNNFQTLTRNDTRLAIEKLSDTLHLPVYEATMTRIDAATNMIMKYPPNVYYNHLGESYPSMRLVQPDGLYYTPKSKKETRVFYNKVKEQTVKNQPIPELFKNSNTLRYEQRYLKQLSKTFNVERVTAAMLYDERFYIDIIDRWKQGYDSIKKINDTEINIDAMRTKTNLYKLGIQALAEINGGALNLLQQITEATERGELTRKQKHDLKEAIEQACEVKTDIVRPNEAIQELTTKIHQAASCYR